MAPQFCGSRLAGSPDRRNGFTAELQTITSPGSRASPLPQACAKKPNGPWPAACSFKALRRLLRETQLSVVTVANEVGYSNPSHFAPVFRKHTGLSPSDYRRQR